MPKTVIVLKGGLVHRLYSDFEDHEVTIMDIDEDAEEPVHIHTETAKTAKEKGNLERIQRIIKENYTKK